MHSNRPSILRLPDKAITAVQDAQLESAEIREMPLPIQLVSLTQERFMGRGWLAPTNESPLRERNEGVPQNAMAELLEGGVFMAVGTYHWLKDYGLITFIRKAGFAVDRTSFKGEQRP